MNKVTVKNDQTIYDIAVQEYGSIEGIFWLMEDNPELNLQDDLVVGGQLLIRDSVIDPELKSYLQENGVSPANGGGKDPGISAFTNGFLTEAFN